MVIRKYLALVIYAFILLMILLAFWVKFIYQWLVLPIYLICGFVSLGLITSDFLTPNLSIIAKELLHISDRISGMTLLALGNAIPDITSTYKAIDSGVVSLAIGELLGAIFFSLTVVIGSMAILRPINLFIPQELDIEYSGGRNNQSTNQSTVYYNRCQFVKDLCMFSFMIFMSVIFLCDGTLYFWECFVMCIIYCFYMTYSIYETLYSIDIETNNHKEENFIETSLSQDYLERPDRVNGENILTFLESLKFKKMKLRHEIREYLRNHYRGWITLSLNDTLELWDNNDIFEKEDDLEDHENNLLLTEVDSVNRKIIRRTSSEPDVLKTSSLHSSHKYPIFNKPQNDSRIYRSPNTLNLSREMTIRSLSADQFMFLDRNKNLLTSDTFNIVEKDTNQLCIHPKERLGFLYKLNKNLRIGDYLSNEPLDLSLSEFITMIVTVPIVALLTLCIPLYHEDNDIAKSVKKLTIIQCGMSMIFIYGLLTEKIHVWLTITCSLLTFALFIMDHHGFLPIKSKYISIIGFMLSLSFISFIVGQVISMLVHWIEVFNISESILGLTIFAWGNSIGDLVSNITFTKIGVVDIALGSCFGSPLLYFLLGVGMDGMIIMWRKHGLSNTNQSIWGSHIDFHVDGNLIINCVGILIAFSLFSILIPLNNWCIDKQIGIYLLCLYLIVNGFNIYSECWLFI